MVTDDVKLTQEPLPKPDLLELVVLLVLDHEQLEKRVETLETLLRAPELDSLELGLNNNALSKPKPKPSSQDNVHSKRKRSSSIPVTPPSGEPKIKGGPNLWVEVLKYLDKIGWF